MELSSTEDSSDTDEEESAKLKEAVLGSSSFNIGSIKTTLRTQDAEALSKPSLRKQEQFDASHDEQQLQTTPEVKAFVAKHLSNYIESNISMERVGYDSVPLSSSKKDFGIRLFNDSFEFVGIGDEEKPYYMKSQKIKQREQKSISSCSDSEDERSRLAEAAVSYDFIAKNAAPLQSQSKAIEDTATNNSKKIVEEDVSNLKKRKKSRKKKKKEG